MKQLFLGSVGLLVMFTQACGESRKEKQLKDELEQLQAEKAELLKTQANSEQELELSRQTQIENELLLAERNEEIMALTQISLEASTLRVEIEELKAERELILAEIEANKSEVSAAKSRLGETNAALDLSNEKLSRLYAKSLKAVKGLWLNIQPVSQINSSSCYEMAYVSGDGFFSQGIACIDGRVQLQKFAIDQFGGQRLADLTAGQGGVAPIGFAVQGRPLASDCDGQQTILQTSSNLIFEMSKEANGGRGVLLNSLRMRAKLGSSYKDYEAGAQYFSSLMSSDLSAMEVFTSVDDSPTGVLGRAAVALMKAHDGLAAERGCFASGGEFTK